MLGVGDRADACAGTSHSCRQSDGTGGCNRTRFVVDDDEHASEQPNDNNHADDDDLADNDDCTTSHVHHCCADDRHDIGTAIDDHYDRAQVDCDYVDDRSRGRADR